MTLLINLDEVEFEISSIIFSIKPVTQGVFDLLSQLTQYQNVDENNKEIGFKLLNDKRYQKTISNIIKQNCRMINPFQVREKGKIRDGTIDELLEFETIKFVHIKQQLINKLIEISNLTDEENEQIKK